MGFAFCGAVVFRGWVVLLVFFRHEKPLFALLGYCLGSWGFGFFAREEKPEPEGARLASLAEIKAAGLLNNADLSKGLYLGYHRHKRKKKESPRLLYRGENHLITFGKPASGKGSTIIIPNLLLYGGSMFVIDPKGQNAAITARRRREGLKHKVFILNPYGLFKDRLGASARFNPLNKLNTDSPNFVGRVGSLAASLIIQTGNDAHFSDTARQLVEALLMFVCIKYDKDRMRRNLGEVRRILSSGAAFSEGGASPFEAAIFEMCHSDFEPLSNKAAQFAIINKEIQSVISTARTQLAFLDDPAISASLAASDFDFADMKRQKITVFLVLPAEYLESQARWLRLLVTSAIDALTDEPRKGDSRVVFLLDEFAQLGRLAAVERALALVRGYGVQFWFFLQNLPQLQAIYEKQHESFLSVSGVQQFFTPNDKETAGAISKRAGQHLVKRKSTSTSENKSGGGLSSESTAEHWEQFFREWDLYGKQGLNLLVIEGLSPPIEAGRDDYRQALKKVSFDPDPYHQ